MVRQYRTREGDCTAADTKTALLTEGSNASPGALNVPQGARRLVGAVVTTAATYAAADGAGAIVRLEGGGLADGPEVFPAGGAGTAVATGNVSANAAYLIPLNIAVIPGNEISVFGEMVGGDVGQIQIGVTLVFEDR